jgi:hypothetical protein
MPDMKKKQVKVSKQRTFWNSVQALFKKNSTLTTNILLSFRGQYFDYNYDNKGHQLDPEVYFLWDDKCLNLIFNF